MSTKQQNTVKIANEVRKTMSAEFQARVPEASFKYFGDFANPIIKYDALMNEFINGLVNKVGKTFVQSKMATNPLRLLKKGDKPMGSDVEELFVKMAEAQEFDKAGNKLLNRNDARVRVLYHRVNYKASYSVTWSKTELKRGFTSVEALTQLIEEMVNSLYSGAYYDEFQNTKRLIVDSVEKGLFVKKEVVKPIDLNTAKDFAKTIKKDALKMTHMTDKYNLSKETNGTLDPVKTYTPTDKQVLILDSDSLVEVDVELLATVFNMSKADFNQIEHVIHVDDFITSIDGVDKGEDVVAILSDMATFQIYDDQFTMEDVFYNPSNQTYKAYLHVDQTLSVSTLANTVVYTEKKEETGE